MKMSDANFLIVGELNFAVRFGFQPDSFHRAAPDAIYDDLRELAEVVIAHRQASRKLHG